MTLEQKYPRLQVTINPSPWDKTERHSVPAEEVISFIDTQAHQATVEEIIKIAEGMKKDPYGENAEDYGQHKYFEGYDEALQDIVSMLELMNGTTRQKKDLPKRTI